MKNKWLLLDIKQGLLCKKWHLSLKEYISEIAATLS